MAAPSFVKAGGGNTDAGGAWATGGLGDAFGSSHSAGNVIILHVVQDGTTAGALTWSPTGTWLEDLAGTDNQADYIGEFAGGGMIQHLWIARSLGGTNVVPGTGTNSGTDDLYFRFYEFTNVNTGSTLAAVLEQNGTTTPATASGTSTTIADAGVITTGVDRLALNFVGVNDDNALDAFTGMSGGTWAEAVAEYADAGGTDGAVGLQTATMASAGTIDGGTDTMAASDGWGVVGFALIGTTSAAVPTLVWQPAAPTRMRL